ncbi:L-cysteine desulfidase [Sporobacter termitidis DSM 10068]|uniref:UPF0597 protein SAMN02745823_01665 n=1 Tax=Sporobacter termitidis DSM 10068 TaxID=1123282 RepID=A0A1M5XAW4_9FIRM|nr:L-serine ammonia-lyase, iron-sulfur-dependent, subunit alpha [Sporobacter termitidis]SHH97005.1 L-cysteine desulfidase [Sporobacter termitidis DSM 10068]
MDQEIYRAYLDILKEELIPAMGCTEPVAVACAAAKGRELLGLLPERCEISVSGNILKNAKSVIVPNTGGLKGLEAAVAAGVAAGDPAASLEVLSAVSKERFQEIGDYMERHEIRVLLAETGENFHIDLRLSAAGHSARVVVSRRHTNIILLEKDGEPVFQAEDEAGGADGAADRRVLNIRDIVAFAEAVRMSDIESIIDRQVAYNTAIAREGLTGNWGAQIGKTLLSHYDGTDVVVRAKAAAAAGSDARMSGCQLPVVIVSGSGNQGLAASLPVIEFAGHLGNSREALYRALVVSNLVTIYQKAGIGRLSAFCGAVCAGCGAGAGIAFLHGGRYDEIAHTIVNALAVISGMTCDGAKPSCAAKIAAAVDNGIFGYKLYLAGHQFYAGDGIVTKGVDSTIENVARLAREGMHKTDREILSIMVENRRI